MRSGHRGGRISTTISITRSRQESSIPVRHCRLPRFTSGRTGVPPGFGGPETGSVHFGAASGFANGELESQPHNLVHDAIGGLMGDPNTAGLDPIFWLHHANVDRLWQVWVEQPAAAGNPNTPMWLNNVAFSLYDASGMQWTFTSSDVLDTRTVLHGYEYDDQAPAGPGGHRTGGNRDGNGGGRIGRARTDRGKHNRHQPGIR
ncbi:MAG: tyrosinase family protein [Rhodospirillales bacterium]|nr:tyrosinase family protein [Rhodospirillales bacterium]